MKPSRESKRLLVIVPIVLGGVLLTLVTTLRGAMRVEGRNGSRLSTPMGSDSAAPREQVPRGLPGMPMAQSSEFRKTPGAKGTPPADVLIILEAPPFGEMAGLWLDLNRMLEQKDTTSPEMHRLSVIRLTLQFLDLKDPAATAFETAVSEALAQLQSAQDDLHRALELLPPDLLDDERESMNRAILEEYDVRKRSSINSVLTTLGTSGLHPEFREHLEMWFGYLTPL